MFKSVRLSRILAALTITALFAAPALAWPPGGNGGGGNGNGGGGGGGEDPPVALPEYEIDVINTIDGVGLAPGSYRNEWGFNNFGDVVGQTNHGPNDYRPFLDTAAAGAVYINSLIDPAAGWTVFRVMDVNDDLVIVGNARFDFDGDGIPDSGMPAFPIRILPPGAGETYWSVDPLVSFNSGLSGVAAKINNDGDIALRLFVPPSGKAQLGLWYEGIPGGEAAVIESWANINGVTDLSERDANGDIYATMVSIPDGISRGTRYSSKTGLFIDLENSSKNWDSTYAYGVNEFGDFSGAVLLGSTSWNRTLIASLYVEGAGQAELGTLAAKKDDQTSHAYDLNANLDVVGTCFVGGVETGFLYHPTFGMQDLRDLIVNLPAGFSEGLPAFQINEAGQIWGLTEFNEMFILTPVASP